MGRTLVFHRQTHADRNLGLRALGKGVAGAISLDTRTLGEWLTELVAGGWDAGLPALSPFDAGIEPHSLDHSLLIAPIPPDHRDEPAVPV